MSSVLLVAFSDCPGSCCIKGTSLLYEAYSFISRNHSSICENNVIPKGYILIQNLNFRLHYIKITHSKSPHLSAQNRLKNPSVFPLENSPQRVLIRALAYVKGFSFCNSRSVVFADVPEGSHLKYGWCRFLMRNWCHSGRFGQIQSSLESWRKEVNQQVPVQYSLLQPCSFSLFFLTTFWFRSSVL